MSTYTKITRHPITKNYEVATFHDDYFGEHIYGVEFPSDGKVFPTEYVQPAQIENFWAEDVIMAFREYKDGIGETDEEVVEFLNLIEDEYKRRWERDPVGGEGDIDWVQRFTGKPARKVEE